MPQKHPFVAACWLTLSLLAVAVATRCVVTYPPGGQDLFRESAILVALYVVVRAVDKLLSDRPDSP